MDEVLDWLNVDALIGLQCMIGDLFNLFDNPSYRFILIVFLNRNVL